MVFHEQQQRRRSAPPAGMVAPGTRIAPCQHHRATCHARLPSGHSDPFRPDSDHSFRSDQGLSFQFVHSFHSFHPSFRSVDFHSVLPFIARAGPIHPSLHSIPFDHSPAFNSIPDHPAGPPPPPPRCCCHPAPPPGTNPHRAVKTPPARCQDAGRQRHGKDRSQTFHIAIRPQNRAVGITTPRPCDNAACQTARWRWPADRAAENNGSPAARPLVGWTGDPALSAAYATAIRTGDATCQTVTRSNLLRCQHRLRC